MVFAAPDMGHRRAATTTLTDRRGAIQSTRWNVPSRVDRDWWVAGTGLPLC